MFINNNSGITRDIACYFFLSLFVDETTKATHIDIVSGGHIGFYDAKKCLYRSRNICFVDSGAVSDLVDDVSFSHSKYYFRYVVFRDGKFRSPLFICKINLLTISPILRMVRQMAVSLSMNFWKANKERTTFDPFA